MQQSPTLTFESVYAAYETRVYRYLYRLANGDAAAAEDVAQETWIRVYASIGQLQDPTALDGWLYTIARREWLRAHRSPLQTIVMSNQPGTEEIADHSAEKQINQLALQQCLTRLTDPIREALILVKMEQFSHREAAVILGRPEGTVKFQVAEGLRRLKKMLVDDGALAAGAPLGLLESSLRQWGPSHPPRSLGRSVQAALPHAADHLPATPAQEPPLPGTAAARHLSERAVTQRWTRTGLTATAILLALILLARRAPRSSGNANATVPARILAAAADVKTVHALGTYIQFFDVGQTQVGSRPFNYECWYTTPDRYSINLTPFRGSTSAQPSRYLAVDGKAWNIFFGPKGTQVLPAPEPNARPLAAVSFLNERSPLSVALADTDHPPSVVAEESLGPEMRLVTVELRTTATSEHWRLYAHARTGRLERVDFEYWAPGARGLERQLEIVLKQFTYNAPPPDGTFQIPAPR